MYLHKKIMCSQRLTWNKGKDAHTHVTTIKIQKQYKLRISNDVEA